MADGLHRCEKEHPWPTPAHHLAYLRASIGAIAVGLAALARPFLLTILAVVETLKAVLGQLAHRSVGESLSQVVATIDANHQQHHALLVGNERFLFFHLALFHHDCVCIYCACLVVLCALPIIKVSLLQ